MLIKLGVGSANIITQEANIMPCVLANVGNTVITIRAEREPVAPQHSSFIADLDGEQAEKAVRWVNHLKSESIWGWCQVVATVQLGDLVGESRLRYCSYYSEAEFMMTGAYHQLLEEALADLQCLIRRVYKSIHVEQESGRPTQ